MFGNFSYLAWMLIFCVPALSWLWMRHFTLLIRNKKVLLVTIGTGLLWWAVADPLASALHPWFYSSDRILGPWLLGGPIEDAPYAVLVSLVISTGVIVAIDWRRKGRRAFLVGRN